MGRSTYHFGTPMVRNSTSPREKTIRAINGRRSGRIFMFRRKACVFQTSESFVGDLWYRTNVKLSKAQASASPHIRFPGLFNNCEFICRWTGGRQARDRGSMVVERLSLRVGRVAARSLASRRQCDCIAVSQPAPHGRHVSPTISLCAPLARLRHELLWQAIFAGRIALQHGH